MKGTTNSTEARSVTSPALRWAIVRGRRNPSSYSWLTAAIVLDVGKDKDGNDFTIARLETSASQPNCFAYTA